MRRAPVVLLTLLLALLGVSAVSAPSASAEVPGNNDLANAAALVDGTLSLNNLEATNEANEPTIAGQGCNGLANSLWFKFTLGGPVTKTFSTATPTPGSAPDTVLRLYSGPADAPTPATLMGIGCDDDSGAGTTSLLQRDLSAGTYYLQVGTFDAVLDNNGPGPFSLTTSSAATPPVPGNDLLSAAAALSQGTTQVDNRSASLESGEPSGQSGCLTLNRSVWFRFTADATAPRRLRTSGTNGDTVVRVFSGPAFMPTFGSLTFVGCDDNAGDGAYSLVDLNVVNGTTYYVQVGTFRQSPTDTDPGPHAFQLTFNDPTTAPPPNDLVASPTVLTVPQGATSGTFSTSTVNATETAGEPSRTGGLRTVWLSYTARYQGPLRFDTSTAAAGLDTYLCAFPATGAVTPMTALDCNDDLAPMDPRSSIVIDAAANTTYRVLVATSALSPGTTVDGTWAYLPPPNDSRLTPEDIGGSAGTAEVNNRFATADPTDPMATDQGFTVWYSWSPGSNGPVTFRTTSATSGTDTVLTVYRVDGANLVQVATHDDIDFPDNTLSMLDFVADVTQTYLVRVGGFGVVSANPSMLVWEPYGDAAPTTTDATPGPITDGAVAISAVTTLVTPTGADLAGTVFVSRGEADLGSSPTTDGTAALSAALRPGANGLEVRYVANDYHVGTSSDSIDVYYTAPTTTSLTSVVSGQRVTLDATVALTTPVSGYVPAGTVQFFEGSASRGGTTLVDGAAQLVLTNVTPGSHSYTAVYTPAGTETATSTSPAKSATVAKLASKTKVTGPKTAKAGDQPTVAVKVTIAGKPATGKVTLFLNGKKLKTLTLKSGKVSYKLPPLKAGQAKVKATYAGSKTGKGSTFTLPIAVRR